MKKLANKFSLFSSHKYFARSEVNIAIDLDEISGKEQAIAENSASAGNGENEGNCDGITEITDSNEGTDVDQSFNKVVAIASSQPDTSNAINFEFQKEVEESSEQNKSISPKEPSQEKGEILRWQLCPKILEFHCYL